MQTSLPSTISATTAGQPYIVSQYMGGGDLDRILNKAPDRRLPISEAIRITQQVQQGLAHAHGRGIIHRDLKPGNIWLTEDGTAKIGDFGLAVALDRSRLTMEGMMVGTVAYMPPEQALGRQPDARSDLYSLGCVVYEMVTGRAPFLGDDPVAIISQHINTAPVAPSWHNSEVPRALQSLVLRLLAKDPNERPESAAAIPQALQAIFDTASTTAPAAAESDVNLLDRLAAGIFVGREKEMDELRAGLEDSLSGRGRLMMLVGEPGIGKTRTSEEFATYARLRNVHVLWGRCYEGEGAPAYWPWVQIIRSYIHDKEPKELMSEMGPGAADIARVVSEVGERLPGLPTPPALEPEQARFRLFDSITTFLKNASEDTPLMVVLDDMHWADKPSLLLLQFLAKELRGARLLVLGTYRDVELGRQHPLAQTLGELNRENLSQRILLRGLTAQDVQRFIEITAAITPPPALVEAVFKETEGNPFFVNEIVRLLVADGRLEHPEAVKQWSVSIPQSVREVVGRRLDHLSDACNKVLTIGSVIGREFSLRVLEKVGDVSGDRLLEALEEAVAARVITEVPRMPDQYSFSHALIRETLYEELSTARRVRVHRQIGEVLETLDPESHLPQLAYHFCEGAQAGDVHKAVDYARRAGERALTLLAYEEAVGHYERALQTLELKSKPDEGERCELLLALGDALNKMGDVPRAREIFQQAASIARKLRDSERLGRAALGYASYFEPGTSQEPSVRILEEALAAVGEGDSPLRVQLLAILARELYFSEWHERARSLSREAIEIARRVGDPVALGLALFSTLFFVEAGEDVKRQFEERLAAGTEIIRLAEEAGDKAMALNGHDARVMALLTLGDIEALNQELEVYGRLAEELRQPFFLWQEAGFRAMRALFDGRLEEAERLAQQALAVGRRSQGPAAMQAFGAGLYALRREQGRLAEVEAAATSFIQQYPAVPAWRAAVALIHMELGQEEKARREFEPLAEDDFAIFPRDGVWPISMAILAELAVYLNDRERAAALYEHLRPRAELTIVVGLTIDCYGSTSHYLGLLAGALGRWEDAERHFEYALEANKRMGTPRWTGWGQYRYAKMLLDRDGQGDREKALSLVSQALDTGQSLGMTGLVERALALKLRTQGIEASDLKTSIDAVASAVYVEKPDLPAKAVAPDGTVTIMFSDIEGSTAMTERLGDKRWLELLREHNAIVRKHVKAHRGFEVKSEGDGFMIAFQSARRALGCAIELQRALTARNAKARESIQVRVGLHTGEAIKEGKDFFGKDVILAARIAGQAKGGEILVSGLLKALVDSGGEIEWGEVRTAELKGLSGVYDLTAVIWAGDANQP